MLLASAWHATTSSALLINARLPHLTGPHRWEIATVCGLLRRFCSGVRVGSPSTAAVLAEGTVDWVGPSSVLRVHHAAPGPVVAVFAGVRDPVSSRGAPS
jgi:hypothetical protein